MLLKPGEKREPATLACLAVNSVIAEGVEELEQAKHLSDRGCGVAQGYGFGRPMPPKEFTIWLAANAAKTLHVEPQTPPVARRA